MGALCLPNFQRDFVWTRDEVADLVRSILRGYFIGSLLLLRCDPTSPPFAPVFLRGASPAHVHPKPELLVLDGQQRLSSLLYALTAPDLSLKDSSQRRWFFVDLDLLSASQTTTRSSSTGLQRELRGLDTSRGAVRQSHPSMHRFFTLSVLRLARRIRGLASDRRDRRTGSSATRRSGANAWTEAATALPDLRRSSR